MKTWKIECAHPDLEGAKPDLGGCLCSEKGGGGGVYVVKEGVNSLLALT